MSTRTLPDTRRAAPYQKWKFFKPHPEIFIPKLSLIEPGTPIFCMGSCFAIEIKKVLKSLGYEVKPWNEGLRVDAAGELFTASGLEFVHFNTFTMLQEFEKAFGLWIQEDDDYWTVERMEGGDRVRFFQDPYRRVVYHPTREGVLRITRAFDEVIRRGILESEVYILTLGLTEVWKKKNNGRYACTEPGSSRGGGKGLVEFVRTGFSENYANLKKIVEILSGRFPQRHVVLTVSPVPLSRTFAERDVFTATVENKSILRAAAAEISAEFPNVHYFPSYEMCALADKYRLAEVFNPDGRHVKPEMVRSIVDAFLGACAVS